MDDRREEFGWYADWAADVSPLYERLARGVADAPDLLDVAGEAPEGQPGPQLLLGAVHALLLDEVDRRDGTDGSRPDHPLADLYPTCSDDPADPRETDPFPPFREFVRAREDEVRSIVASRRVQTNEVGRAAVLLPAFEHVSRVASGDGSRDTGRAPLALVEVGASAGLNLRWDRYRYEYATDDGARTVCGPRDAAVTVESAVRGDRDPPLPGSPTDDEPPPDGGLPDVGHRVGVDLDPLDVTDPGDAHWLRALVIPDQRERHERLAAAIDVVRDDPPELVAGDALDVLPDLLDGVPEDATRCVFSTVTLYQLSDDEVRELRDLLAERSHERPVHWLSGDPSADLDDGLSYRHVAFSGGDAAETLLAEFESYGAWVRWLAEGDRKTASPG